MVGGSVAVTCGCSKAQPLASSGAGPHHVICSWGNACARYVEGKMVIYGRTVQCQGSWLPLRAVWKETAAHFPDELQRPDCFHDVLIITTLVLSLTPPSSSSSTPTCIQFNFMIVTRRLYFSEIFGSVLYSVKM